MDNKKKTKRMTKEEFLRSLRGCDDGKDIERDYLSRIFDSIMDDPTLEASKRWTNDDGEVGGRLRCLLEANDFSVVSKRVDKWCMFICTPI
jgi:hypothetical protein